ncbi:ATP-dependent nuclease subunit B [Candidatus Terasakiella magnetica]|uniref:ATP-dependent nuclease subunit B n=1 Tax=Candidatus Terasakiella magnetica TaxID=1867952 RepID=A0A1C3RGY0_9PROT|nr:double-strand break repair protein AddB [Candidatus Terasakiella magnetica]SCA56452.1 ATP-dependent nuclease subunit B [Candidatus Terasakiella magnetica]
MNTKTPHVLSISPNVSFADALAHGVMEKFGSKPENLSQVTLLLPTRRACRTVRDAFLRLSQGKPLLLPRMQPLGDLDEDELSLTGWKDIGGLNAVKPAIAPLRRQMLLTRLILTFEGGNTTADQAAQLAGELANLLDQVHTEGLSFHELQSLVPEDYADHWNITLDFLKILTDSWPTILEAEGTLDPADRRNRLLDAQRTVWENTPPQGPIIAAGSTASIPAVAKLLACIARLPQGMVVLPGLDRHMEEEDWENLDANHPQYGLKQLLSRLRMAPEEVEDWQASGLAGSHPLRAKLLSEAMLPAASTDKWRTMDHPAGGLLDGVERIDCPTPFEEAKAIALLLRRELSMDGNTAALVTPDRNLARRVASELRRWNIEIDDSAGTPLQHCATGTYLRLLAQCVAEDFAPVPFLALCKHPLSSASMEAKIFRHLIRQLELQVLRGPRPGSGIEGLHHALDRCETNWRKRTNRLSAPQKKLLESLRGLLGAIESALHPFIKVMKRKKTDFIKLVESHVKAAEALAETLEDKGVERIWSGEAGETSADFISELLEATADFGELDPQTYPALLDALMLGKAVRPRFGAHPRLAILGLFEARLQKADLIVLAGLNEGTWPPDVTASPWMSRPMMRDFGLPQPEFHIGQTAHDFTQSFCAERVIITRSERVDGTPTVRSRWLRRLENRLSGTELAGDFSGQSGWLSMQAALDYVAKIQAVAPPAPRPPLSARPRKMYVTRVETWMRDPYAIYARNILNIKALDPIDADPSAADYGNIIHEILEKFMIKHPKPLPENAADKLRIMGQEVFGSELDNPGIWAFWWPRFERIANWFVEQEETRRALIAKSYSEIEGSLTFETLGGPFTISAKADRMDLYKDGELAIIDYKTGVPPSQREVEAGFAPQLPLEGAIAMAGGFEEFGPRDIKALEFWRLRGANPAGEIKAASDNPEQTAAEALHGLQHLVSAFDRVESAYGSRPNPENAPKFSDYEHLARVKEWSVSGGEAEE